MKLCDYGCGREAKFQFKNGKWCCSKNHRQCPNKRKSKKYKRKIEFCKYCNKKLFYSNLKQHEPSCYLNPINIKKCLECNNIIKTGNKFCCKSCSISYSNKRRKHSKETKRKISKSLKGQRNGNAKLERYYIRQMKCPICNKIKNIRSRIKNNSIKLKTCSKKCFKQYLKEIGTGGYREGSGYGKSGKYKGIYCASTYELIFLAFHLEKKSKIKRSKKKFPYIYKGKKHLYYPDFEIDNIIYEIKGYKTDKTDLKINAVKNKGYNIKLLFYEDLIHMVNYLKKKFTFNIITDLYDPVV